jgi:hypothetical protein
MLSASLGDFKEQRIEAVVILQRPQPLADALAGGDLAGLIVGPHIPALGWNRADAVAPLRDVLPELAQVLSLGKLSRHPYHGNRLGSRRHLGGAPSAALAPGTQRPGAPLQAQGAPRRHPGAHTAGRRNRRLSLRPALQRSLSLACSAT